MSFFSPWNKKKIQQEKELLPVKRQATQADSELRKTTRVKAQEELKPVKRRAVKEELVPVKRRQTSKARTPAKKRNVQESVLVPVSKRKMQENTMVPVKRKKRLAEKSLAEKKQNVSSSVLAPVDKRQLMSKSVLIPVGKDGKKLDGSEDVNYAILEPEMEERLYSEAIARALVEPHVYSTQANDGESSNAFDNTIILNIPSIDPSGKAVPVTLGKPKAYLMMLKKLATDPGLMNTFSRSVKSQLTVSRFPLGKTNTTISKATPVLRNTKLVRKINTSGLGSVTQGIKKNYKYPISKSCCEKFPARNPDWYYGFYRDTHIYIEGSSNIVNPHGRIIFGPKDGCHAELPIVLPDNRHLPDGSFRNHHYYRIATYIGLEEDSSDPDDWIDPDNWSEQDEEDYELHKTNLVGQGYDRDWLDDILPHPAHIVGSDESKASRGVLFVWNEEIWRCCWKDMPFYKDFPVRYKGFNNDLFDDITIEAELRSRKMSEPPGWGSSIGIYLEHSNLPPITPASDDRFSELELPQIVSPNNEIERVTVRLNQSLILVHDPDPIYQLTTRNELELKTLISNYRRDQLEPTRRSRPYSVLPFKARRESLILTAVDELGQAWNPKYGGTWDKDSSGDWLDGPQNWCSESFNYFFRQQGRFNDIPGGGRNIGIGEMKKEWFWKKGRYICGGSRYSSNRKLVEWNDLGNTLKRFVLPGYFVSFRNGYHAGIFMYWTVPPEQPDRPADWPDKGYSTENIEELKEIYNMLNTDPFNNLIKNEDRINNATRFDPSKTLNCFRLINGNSWGKVRIATSTIARCKSKAEADFWLHWQSIAGPGEVNQNSITTQPVTIGSSRRNTAEEDKHENSLVLWRDYNDVELDWSNDLDQDGFGQTYGYPIVLPSDIEEE